MKKIIKKINDINFQNNLFLITYIVISIISLLYVAKILFNHGMKISIIISLLLAISEVIIYFFLKKKIKNGIKLHKLYLIIVTVFGIFYILGFPPSQLPDDGSDYLRALEVSEFHATSETKDEMVGREFSKNILKVYDSKNYDDYIKNKDLKLDGEKDFIGFANKSLYAFVCYLPQAIGIGIGRLFGLPIVFQIIFGKICNFILFVVLTYLAIKYIPTKKELIFFICLLPITLQEATSLSADCMTIATTIALESFVIWAKITKKEFEKKHYISLAILLLFLSLAKIVYLPLCFLILLIPEKCFKTNKKKIIYCCSVLLLAIIVNLIWLKLSSPYLAAFMNSRGSNSSEQLKYILLNPIRYVFILFNTIDTNIYSYLEQMTGHALGSFTVSTSYVFVIITLSILFYLISEKDYKDSMLNNIEKIFSILIISGTTILIFTSLYLQWTPVCADIVDGIQGRYFIPLLPLIGMLFITKKRKEEKINPLILIVSIMFNIIAIISIYKTYI